MKLLELQGSSLDLSSYPKVIKAFHELGDEQRGLPEAAMLKVQRLMGGGVLNPVVEHAGDLTHRMTHMLPRDGLHGIVEDKIEKVHYRLTHPYGFEKEFQENIQSNANYYKKDPETLKDQIYRALEVYKREHSKLEVYNEIQWLARETAVMIGDRRFFKAVAHLKEMMKFARSREIYDRAVREFKVDSQGNPAQYRK